jgi:hypothetical protein
MAGRVAIAPYRPSLRLATAMRFSRARILRSLPLSGSASPPIAMLVPSTVRISTGQWAIYIPFGCGLNLFPS